jgi:hypothetical protein
MSDKPVRPLTMDELFQAIDSIRQAATKSRDRNPLSHNIADQNNWHFFNGKISAINELEAQLEVYRNTFSEGS